MQPLFIVIVTVILRVTIYFPHQNYSSIHIVYLPSSTLNNVFYKFIVESSLYVEYLVKVY